MHADLWTLLTGMGRRNAERAVRETVLADKPEAVLTCGFAGGLNPQLPVGTVVFSADDGFARTDALLGAGARSGTFHCADRVAVRVIRPLRKPKTTFAMFETAGERSGRMEPS